MKPSGREPNHGAGRVGTILADAGPRVGRCSQSLDLDCPRAKERSYGGEVGAGRRFLREDRRPATYERLTEVAT